jgi:hypothetical protein
MATSRQLGSGAKARSIVGTVDAIHHGSRSAATQPLVKAQYQKRRVFYFRGVSGPVAGPGSTPSAGASVTESVVSAFGDDPSRLRLTRRVLSNGVLRAQY